MEQRRGRREAGFGNEVHLLGHLSAKGLLWNSTLGGIGGRQGLVMKFTFLGT